MRTTVIFNCKGGVGKTITTIQLAAELAARDKRIVCVDADPQQNLTGFYLPGKAVDPYNLYDILSGVLDVQGYAYLLDVTDRIRLVPGSMDLILADLHALQGKEIKLTAIRELALALAEDDVADHMLIDCPPSFTAATTAALAAADDVIIPIRLDAFSLAGISELLRQISGIRDVNPTIRVAGALITQYDGTTVAMETESALRESAVPVFETVIHRTTAVDRSTYEHRPVRELPGSYAKRCAEEYATLVNEWLGGAENV